MKELIKTIEEYKIWKTEIRKVLDENFNDIASLMMDAYGPNQIIPFKTEAPTQHTFFNQNNNPILIKGCVINIEQMTGEYMLWFFENGSFYLIQRKSDSNLLNVRPYLSENSGSFFNTQAYKASFDNEINFVLSLIENAGNIVDILKERMGRLKTCEAQGLVKKLASTVRK
ncbi:hypothetical protein ACSV5M_01660 [Cellvibrio sp. ARAG 10.3]|uniref:hypothetical protein n=1 Tax=Cellvibrio sp. ARAG 10.3 TaxID=3451358 RepID=UPI003F4598FE